MAAPERKVAGCQSHGGNLQAVKAGELYGRATLSPRAVLATPPVGSNRTRSNERGPVGRPDPRIRSLLGRGRRFRVLLREVLANVRDLIRAENPGRTLRFDRARERSAQVPANELSVHAEFGRDFLGPHCGLACFGRHSNPPFDRLMLRCNRIITNVRTQAFANEFTYILQSPPHPPPRRALLTWRRKFCRAQRAGCENFDTFSAAYGA